MAEMTGRQLDQGLSRADSTGSRSSLRLVFAVQKYFEFGGLQRDMCRIASACADQGHEVHVVTGAWEGVRPENLHVHLVEFQARTNHGRCEEFGAAVERFVRGRAVDCLVGFNKMAGLDVCWCGDPCLAAKLAEEKSRPLHWLPRYRTYLRLERSVFGSDSDAELLVLTQPEQDRISKHYGTQENRMHLLPGGIDRSRFELGSDRRITREEIRHELRISESSLMVLTVGSSFKTKGVDRSIQALASLPVELRTKSELVVVGNGDRGQFQKIADKANVAERVHFTGGRDDVARFYHAADLLLHPARTETAGHILLEAMICGLPVIVTENCGYAFHVQRAGAGLVCPHPFEQRELNRLLLNACSSNGADRWKQNAFDYCEKTDLYSMVEKAASVIIARAERNRQSGFSQEFRRAS